MLETAKGSNSYAETVAYRVILTASIFGLKCSQIELEKSQGYFDENTDLDAIFSLGGLWVLGIFEYGLLTLCYKCRVFTFIMTRRNSDHIHWDFYSHIFWPSHEMENKNSWK